MGFLNFTNAQFRWKLRGRGPKAQFYPVRTEPLERTLGVVKTARREGVVNHPPEQATGLSAFEMQILEAHGALHQDSTDNYKRVYAEHQGVVSEAAAAWQADHFSTYVADAERACRAELRDVREAIENSWKQVGLAREKLEHYRKVHGLRYEPIRYQGRFQRFAVLVALMVGEGVLNANMFADASERALLGGFREAFTISFASVAFSAGAGYLMRFGNARSFVLQRIGTAARWGWGPLIAGLHLTVGHYRDAMMAGEAYPAQAAIASLYTHPLQLQEFHSMLLVLLGLVAAAVAAAEGYRLDDPFPGYGDVARQEARARDAHADLKFSLLERLTDIADQGRDAVRAAYEEARDRLADYEDGLRDAIDILRRYAALSEHIKASCRRLVQLYRQTNISERSEMPPAYFSTDPPLPFDMDPELRGDLEQAQAMLGDIKTTEILRGLKARAVETEGAIDAVEHTYREQALAIFGQVEGKAP